MCLCVLVCVNFGDEILLRGKNVKPVKIRNFKNRKMIIIIIINYHNGSGKPRKFSKSLMAKRTAPLNSSYEI